MRDPQRIDRMVWKLAALWRAHPDTRLTQVICNLASKVDAGFHLDPFFCEDDRIEEVMDEELEGP